MVLKLHSAKTAGPNKTQLGELVKTHDKTCPVVNLKTYLAASNRSFGPLFQLLSGDKVSGSSLRDKLRTILQFFKISGRRCQLP